MWQEILVGVMVLAAVAFLARRFWPKSAGGTGSCGGCNSCDAPKKKSCCD